MDDCYYKFSKAAAPLMIFLQTLETTPGNVRLDSVGGSLSAAIYQLEKEVKSILQMSMGKGHQQALEYYEKHVQKQQRDVPHVPQFSAPNPKRFKSGKDFGASNRGPQATEGDRSLLQSVKGEKACAFFQVPLLDSSSRDMLSVKTGCSLSAEECKFKHSKVTLQGGLKYM